MDRGAARSRKRLEKADKAATKLAAAEAARTVSNPRLAKLLAPEAKTAKGDKLRPHKGKGKERIESKGSEVGTKADKGGKQDGGPDQYKAKAIRSAHALVYSQETFDLPPPAARLEGVTRVDLEGSQCDDVSWLPKSVTWLSLKGCRVTKGWGVVGSLDGLAVLNISYCDLDALPKELTALKSLKALVAIGNTWTTLDPDVVAGWTNLNSLIVSHSPNLSSLPSTLAQLPHLAKLTFSHCPRLTPSALPDLTALPLLRDVRANNLPRLDSLPSHMSKWGTGDLSLAGKASSSTTKLGDGLEVLDLGNCSLPYSSVSTTFGLVQVPNATKKAARWPHLRSLTLQANPLAVEQPSYAEQLQTSGDLPKLQIIDARRVKERAKAGMAPESKKDKKAREKREAKMRPTGANEHSGGKPMRKWGGDATATSPGDDPQRQRPGKPKGEHSDPLGVSSEKTRQGDDPAATNTERIDKKRKSQHERSSSTGSKKRSREEPVLSPGIDSAGGGKKKRKRKHGGSDKESIDSTLPSVPMAKPSVTSRELKAAVPRVSAQVAAHVAVADPAKQRAKKPGRSETAVVGVVDVKKANVKGGGVDLKAALGSGPGLPNQADAPGGSGLGVGGW